MPCPGLLHSEPLWQATADLTSPGGTQTQFWLSLGQFGMHFVPFPGLSSSGNQVLGKHTAPGGPCILITSPVPASQFPCVLKSSVSDVSYVSLESWSLAATLLVDVNHSRSQEDMVSSWEPAHSLVEDAISGAEIVAYTYHCSIYISSLKSNLTLFLFIHRIRK